MSTDTGAADGEVALEALRPTHINVHIYQKSALAELLLGGCSLLRLPGATQTLGPSRLLVASWVVQLVLGILSLILGGLLFISWYSGPYFSGPAIWTGVVAVLAGATAFLYEKRGVIYWALLRALLALAAFCTAIAAITIGAGNFRVYSYIFRDDACEVSRRSGYWPTAPPTTPSPEEVTRLHRCISYLNMLKAMVVSLQAMLLGVWVLLLLASLVPLCLYCWKRFPFKKKRDQKELLGANGI